MIIGDKMVTVDDIKNSLNQNKNLTKEIKANIFELVLVFNSKYPDVSLNRLNEKLKTIKIIKGSKYVNPRVSEYNLRENTIYLNISEIDKGYDMKHILMFELLNVITCCDRYTGFNIENRFRALNVGYTEIIANYLVGNSGDLLVYPEQAVEANLISILIGEDNISKAYFENDVNSLINGFMKAGVTV